ncbi:MAG: polysaccharide biosynthesis C-terminal domain-containing protein, partial [Chitinophagales bacterium]|nr:polysaccharide biosynthesis C-terminal domain-containing protein [Chitinophagales bacterium]
LSIAYFALTFVYALSTGMNEMQMQMLLFLAINQLLLSAILYFRSNIAALQLFKTDSFISVLDRLLTILFCSALMYAPFWKGGFNILWFIYAQTIALALTAAIAFVVVAGKTVIHTKIWQWKFSRLILMKSMPFAVLALLMSIYSRVDVVLLERLIPDGKLQAGIYAASFRLLDAVNMFGYLFSVLLFPMFASMIRKRKNTFELVKFSGETMFVFSFICAALCYFFSAEIMHLLYHQADESWSQIFGVLMLSFVPMSSVYVFGTLLTANGNMKLLVQIALVGVVFNLLLNFWLIPKQGALGCAVAALITQLLVAGLHLLAAKIKFDMQASAKALLKLAGFSTLCIVSTYFISMASIQWFWLFIFSGICSVALAYAFALVPVQELMKIAQRKQR